MQVSSRSDHEKGERCGEGEWMDTEEIHKGNGFPVVKESTHSSNQSILTVRSRLDSSQFQFYFKPNFTAKIMNRSISIYRSISVDRMNVCIP